MKETQYITVDFEVVEGVIADETQIAYILGDKAYNDKHEQIATLKYAHHYDLTSIPE